eukprot:TRINITY_DN124540_c0_g1_i1.p1 TRINITY_DN124540_c0_g1~~TRINITY_DN124540_c0_g1_i1.p1  ORF type:complete len:598 (-),score=25.63 TRINITY_DN124540_c0_g1_i1:161-1954(-)
MSLFAQYIFINLMAEEIKGTETKQKPAKKEKKYCDLPRFFSKLKGKHYLLKYTSTVDPKYSIAYDSHNEPIEQKHQDQKPVYLINMLFHEDENNPDRVETKITQLFDEAFGEFPEASCAECRSRVAAVIFINRRETHHQEDNLFCSYVPKSLAVQKQSIVYITSLWKGKWERKGKNKKNPECLHKTIKFFIKTCLRPEFQKECRKAMSSAKQPPFKDLREIVKNCKESTKFINHFRKSYPESPLYIITMDSDFILLRGENGIGFLSNYDEIISDFQRKNKYYPCVVSTGYRSSSCELPIFRVGMAVDMACREATTSVIPNGIFYPEPCFAFYLPKDKSIYKYSFTGDKYKTEASQLLCSAIANSLIIEKDMVFCNKSGGIVTTIPQRWQKKAYQNREYLTEATIPKYGLQGVGQSHAHPKKWAQAVNRSCKLKTTAPLYPIFNAFSPFKIKKKVGNTISIKGWYCAFAYRLYSIICEAILLITAEDKPKYKEKFTERAKEIEEKYGIEIKNLGDALENLITQVPDPANLKKICFVAYYCGAKVWRILRRYFGYKANHKDYLTLPSQNIFQSQRYITVKSAFTTRNDSQHCFKKNLAK